MSVCIYVVCCVVQFSDLLLYVFFFFKQKTAYEMRISDWSSDVCSSDLPHLRPNAIFTASSTADFPALFSPIKTEIGESEISRSRMHLKFLMIRRQMCIAVDPEGRRCTRAVL